METIKRMLASEMTIESNDEMKDLTGARTAMIILVLLSGLCVFIPFSGIFKPKEQAVGETSKAPKYG